MKFLFDPRIFNFVIMGLYACNIVRWSYAKSIGDACYWASALGITASVTFGFKH